MTVSPVVDETTSLGTLMPAVESLVSMKLGLNQPPTASLIGEADQDEAPLNVLEVVIPFTGGPLSLKGFKALRGEILDLITSHGERGFVHLRFSFDPRQQAADWSRE